jgi:hypothetical protein
MVEVICIDDNNKPEGIPGRFWIKEGEKVHITLVTFHPMQDGGIQGCELYEKPLPLEHCAPYNFWKLSRFGITADNLKELIELIEQSTELNEVDIRSLIEESELQTV